MRGRRKDSGVIACGSRRSRSESLGMRPSVDEAAVIGLEFSECLPMDYAIEMPQNRLTDAAATKAYAG